MKYLAGNYYVGVEAHGHRVHPTENEISLKRDPPQSLKIQYHVQIETQIRKKQKVIRDGNNELVVKNYLQTNKQKFNNEKFNLRSCPRCKQNW